MSLLILGVGKTSSGLSVSAFDQKAGAGNAMPSHSLTGVPAGAVLILMSSIALGAGTCAVTSSPSLTWTVQASVADTATAILTTVFAAGGSITVTPNWSDPTNAESVCGWVTGQESVLGGASLSVSATAGPGFGAPGSGSITTTRAGSIIFGVVGDRNNVAGTISYLDTPTQIFAQQSVGPFFYTFYQLAPTIAAHNMGMITPATGARDGLCLYEIRTP